MYGIPDVENFFNPNLDSNDIKDINPNAGLEDLIKPNLNPDNSDFIHKNPDPSDIININHNPDSSDILVKDPSPDPNDVTPNDGLMETFAMKRNRIPSFPMSDRVSLLDPVPVKTPALGSVPLKGSTSDQNPESVPMDLSIDAGQVDRYLAWKYRISKK